MVRLVFRPYTQIRRTICTSVSLRASTRVSPGFALFRHRSPSFGSQQICSYSNHSQVTDRSIVHPDKLSPGSYLLLSLRIEGFATLILAYTLDSLVRVSRRVIENHFFRIVNETASSVSQTSTPNKSHRPQLCCFQQVPEQDSEPLSRLARIIVPQSTPR